MSKSIYQVEQFNTENAPKDMVQYVIDNVDDFGQRYSCAWRIIGRDRCPLAHADHKLFSAIGDAISDWCLDNDQDPDSYDIEEIFG